MKSDKYNFCVRLIEINSSRVIHGLSFNLYRLRESCFSGAWLPIAFFTTFDEIIKYHIEIIEINCIVLMKNI